MGVSPAGYGRGQLLRGAVLTKITEFAHKGALLAGMLLAAIVATVGAACHGIGLALLDAAEWAVNKMEHSKCQ